MGCEKSYTEEGYHVKEFDYDVLHGQALSHWGWSTELIRLPSDNAAAETLHGPCRTYRLGKPITLQELEAMPKDLQLQYLRALRRRGGSSTSVSRMLGTTPAQLSLRWNVCFDQPNPTAWAAFLSQC